MTNEKCTCDCYDDGDGENGPHLVVDRDRDCPWHGAGADPIWWSEVDREEAAFEAAELHFAMKSSIARNPEITDTSFHKRRANLELDAYYAHCNEETNRKCIQCSTPIDEPGKRVCDACNESDR